MHVDCQKTGEVWVVALPLPLVAEEGGLRFEDLSVALWIDELHQERRMDFPFRFRLLAEIEDLPVVKLDRPRVCFLSWFHFCLPYTCRVSHVLPGRNLWRPGASSTPGLFRPASNKVNALA